MLLLCRPNKCCGWHRFRRLQRWWIVARRWQIDKEDRGRGRRGAAPTAKRTPTCFYSGMSRMGSRLRQQIPCFEWCCDFKQQWNLFQNLLFKACPFNLFLALHTGALPTDSTSYTESGKKPRARRLLIILRNEGERGECKKKGIFSRSAFQVIFKSCYREWSRRCKLIEVVVFRLLVLSRCGGGSPNLWPELFIVSISLPHFRVPTDRRLWGPFHPFLIHDFLWIPVIISHGNYPPGD